MKLEFVIGDETDRQAEAAARFERGVVLLRNNRPAPLMHRQAAALAGELYRTWN